MRGSDGRTRARLLVFMGKTAAVAAPAAITMVVSEPAV